MGKIAAGIDVGSLFTKTVIINDGGNIIASHVGRSGACYEGAAEASMEHALDSSDLEMDDISCVISTGYGRAKVPFARRHVTEITCHAKGAKTLFPEAKTIIDIGGQDSKVIYVNEQGHPLNFVMNDKCAAGTGRFLEVMAGALEIDLDEMGPLSFQAQNESVEVSSMCTVFAETEVISLLAQGHHKGDIAAAIFSAIARRVTGLAGQLGVQEPVVMSGGVAKGIGIVRALEKKLRTSLLLPPEPQLVGALGAAIIAAEES
jgi:predicted CoA-substrate-specific enzyme activase